MTSAINWYRGLVVSNQRAMWRSSTVPTTLVWGDADTLMSRKAVDLTAERVSGEYRLQIVPGGNHWLPEQNPGEVVAAFLATATQASD